MDLLRPYQREGAAFLSIADHPLLADEPRVGKTASAIAACDNLAARDVCWLTTGSAKVDHARAWKRFQMVDRPVTVHSGSISRPKAGVNILNYDMLQDPELLKAFAVRCSWDVLVLDEMHKLKTPDIGRTLAVYGMGCRCEPGCLAAAAEHVMALSGTPSPNNYSELFPWLRALHPNAIINAKTGKPYTFNQFTERYCTIKNKGFGPVIVGNRNAKDLKARISPYVLRRTLKEVAPLVPRLQADTLPLGRPGDVAALMAIELRARITGFASTFDDPKLSQDTKDALLADLMKKVDATELRQTGLAKVEPVIDWLIDEAPAKIVIWAWHTEVLTALLNGLGGTANCCVVVGATPTRARQMQVDDFRNKPRKRFFLGQIIAAGEAIDLSVADEALFVESSWVPGHNEQAAKRIVNMNKTTPTLARFATIPGSIDDRVQDVAARKLSDIKNLFGS